MVLYIEIQCAGGMKYVIRKDRAVIGSYVGAMNLRCFFKKLPQFQSAGCKACKGEEYTAGYNYTDSAQVSMNCS